MRCSYMKWIGGRWERVERTMNQVRTIMMERKQGKGGEMPRHTKDRAKDRTLSKVRGAGRRNQAGGAGSNRK